MTLNPSVFLDYNFDSKFSFDKEEKYINLVDYQNICKSENKKGTDESVFNFCSETNKYILCLSFSFFHFFTESFANLLLLYKKDPSLEVIIVEPMINNKKVLVELFSRNEIKMFFLFLTTNNISYKIVKINTINNAKINNFFLYSENIDDSRNQANLLSEMSKPYVRKRNKGHKAYIHTNRVKDEKKLEKYLKSFGFDIIDANSFQNFIEQFNYYYNCDVLISATSGGLVNSSFMNNGSLVIELVTLVPQYSEYVKRSEEVHHIYDTLSLQKNHIYVGLSNIDKTAEDIIQQFENNKFLKISLGQK